MAVISKVFFIPTDAHSNCLTLSKPKKTAEVIVPDMQIYMHKSVNVSVKTDNVQL